MIELEKITGNFFHEVASQYTLPIPCHFLLLTHLLGDRPVFVRSLHQIGTVSEIVSIPYSEIPSVKAGLQENFSVNSNATLEDLLHSDYLYKLACNILDKTETPLIIMEIGGYFSHHAKLLKDLYKDKFIGCIEDTENGHRRYESINERNYKVVSVARSPLKIVEDKLIGPSVIYSLERQLRILGQVLRNSTVGVIGYGKIGHGCADAARRLGGHVTVYDKSAIKRAEAIADGFLVTAKEELLSKCTIIVGATGTCSVQGDELLILQDGAILVSASSKQVEFDMNSIKERSIGRIVRENVYIYTLQHDHDIILLADGAPANFMDGAVVGSSLALVQSELLAAAKTLVTSDENYHQILEVSNEDREELATMWQSHFVTSQGHFLHTLNIS